MAADAPRKRRDPSGDDVPVVRPTVPPTVQPVRKGDAPPTVQPVRRGDAPPKVAPTVPPTVKPTAPPAAAPVAAPVAAAPAPAVVERHARTADRVVAYTGMPLALQAAVAILLLTALGAFFAWHFTRTAATGVLDAVDRFGIAAARVLAAPEIEWWSREHGTAEDLRERMAASLSRAELEVRKMEDGPEKEARREEIERIRTKVVPEWLSDKPGVDDLQASRNRERLKKVAESPEILGVEIYGPQRNPLARGTPMPTAELAKVGENLVGEFRIVRKDGGEEVRGRLYMAPVRGREADASGEFRIVGYAGVAVSTEAAWAVVEEARRKALHSGGAVLGCGLLAALFAFLMLSPLRRVLRDAEEFSRGNFDHRPSPAGGGEVGAVGRAVARAALAAKDREQDALAKAAAAVPPPPDHRAEVGAGLAPGPLLRVPGWEIEGTSRACREIAGDFFDYAAAAGGRVSAILVETSLRGLPAAFVSAEIRGLYRGLAPGADSASVLLDSIGAIVGKRLPADASVLATCVLADPGTGEVEIARAGKGNPPVAWRAADRSLERIEVEGPPLAKEGGAGTGGSAGTVRFELHPRDRLSLVSDGLYRARNSRKEKFGEERLDGLILKFGPMNSTAFVNMVTNEVDLFHEGAPQTDDLTVLTVRRLK